MKKQPVRIFGFGAPVFLRAGAFVILWLSSISLPVNLLDVSLDNSWKGVLTDAARQHRQFGSALVFTYGPLGHLLSDVYAGQPLAPQAAWELALKAVMALLVLWAAARLRNVWLEALFVVLACLFSTLDPDAFYFLLIVMVGTFLMEVRQYRRAYWVEGASLLALLAMTKFSYFLLGTFAVGTVAWRGWLDRKLKDSALIAAAYLGLLLIIWTACGQELRNLPAFLRGSLEITLGYAGAMGLTVKPWGLVWGLAAFLPAAAALAALLWRDRRRLEQGPETLLQAAALFMAWKSAFVRPDMHVVVLFEFCLLAFFLYAPRLAALKRGRAAGLALGAFSALASLGALYEIGRTLAWPYFVAGSPGRVERQVANNFKLMMDLPGRERFLTEGLRRQWSLLDMPRTREALHGAGVDMLGQAQGLVLLNNLRYQPRPAFQSYLAYTPYLLRRNAEYLASPGAPEFLLLKLEPIDGRFPASEDSLALRVALERYEPVLTERTCLLMRRKAAASPAPPAALLAAGEYGWGETVPVPPSVSGVWAEIDIEPTPAGRLLSLLYEPPLVFLETRLGEDPARGFRLVPSVAREGFLLNPVVDDALSLENAAKPSAGRQMKSFVLSLSPGGSPFVGPTFKARFYAAGL